MFRSILVAVDGTAGSDRGVDLAIGLAVANDARLKLIASSHQSFASGFAHASEVPANPPSEVPAAWARRALAASEARVPAGVRVTTVLTPRKLASVLVEEADNDGHDLIVVGSGGRGRALPTLRHSGHAVARRTKTPVLLVRDE